MARTRPTDYPEWAMLDAVDPTSGQNNVVDPPVAWKEYGWTYQEKPARNYDNWFKRTANQWIEYLDAAPGRGATITVAADDALEACKDNADFICDGTNDEVEIQAGLDAVIAAGGGTLLLTEGTFNVLDEVTSALVEGVHIRGQGAGATTILVDPLVAAGFSIFNFTAAQNVSFSGITFNANQTNHAEQVSAVNFGIIDRGIAFSCEFLLFDAATPALILAAGIGFCVQNSFFLQAGVSLGTIASGTSFITNCFFDGNSISNHAIDIAAGENNKISNCLIVDYADDSVGIVGDGSIIENTKIEDGGGIGLSANGDDNKIVNCAIVGSDETGLVITGERTLISGCDISLNGYHGILLDDADGGLITNNQIRENSQDVDETYDGVHIGANSDDNIVTNNVIFRGAGAVQQRMGALADAAASNNYLFGNYMVDAGKTANTNGTFLTIPEWIGTDAHDNVQNDVTKANKV